MISPPTLETSVTLERTGSVATITIGSGERLNALRTGDWQEIERLATVLGGDESVASVVFRGRDGVFCSGSDLHEWATSSAERVDASFVQMERAFRAVEAIPVPTVAFVERVAAGAGCQLALACDLQLLPVSAKIGMPISRLGILVPPSFARRLVDRVGPSAAKALLYGGALLPAEEALRVGLITHAPTDDAAANELDATLQTWSTMPMSALRAVKASVRLACEPLARPGAEEARSGFVDAGFTRRVAAFLAKKL